MKGLISWTRKPLYPAMAVLIVILAAGGKGIGFDTKMERQPFSGYEKWETVGRLAAEASLSLIREKVSGVPQKGSMIVMTNAGYAEVTGASTQGALDGLMSVTGASRGRNTLIEIHSASWQPLWFAVYDKETGFCSYLEIDSGATAKMAKSTASASSGLFGVTAVERIDAGYLYQHATEYKTKFDKKVFGGNEFRIVTIANSIAAGAPGYAVRAFEFHDHYCPGVTSGILMAEYLKKHFPPGKSGYFVHAVDPWCKEDALLVLLNATPGKRNYAVNYPSDADKAKRVQEAKNASTIIYRQNEHTLRWEGLILAFEWAETSSRNTGNSIIDMLYVDLWYLERMEKSEDFVKVLKTFELPDGISPKDWARPGVDPLTLLGLVEK
jgi:formylmethanofuran dehydrogenase subunit E-like metal-binding protein